MIKTMNLKKETTKKQNQASKDHGVDCICNDTLHFSSDRKFSQITLVHLKRISPLLLEKYSAFYFFQPFLYFNIDSLKACPQVGTTFIKKIYTGLSFNVFITLLRALEYIRSINLARTNIQERLWFR